MKLLHFLFQMTRDKVVWKDGQRLKILEKITEFEDQLFGQFKGSKITPEGKAKAWNNAWLFAVK